MVGFGQCFVEKKAGILWVCRVQASPSGTCRTVRDAVALSWCCYLLIVTSFGGSCEWVVAIVQSFCLGNAATRTCFCFERGTEKLPIMSPD